MDFNDEHTISISDSVVNTEPFRFDFEHVKSSTSLEITHTNYLQMNISEPLNQALIYVLIYQPHDAIEFIANFLIDWSRRKTYQQLIAQNTNIPCEKQNNSEEEQKKKLIFQYDKHVLTSYQGDWHVDPRTDDEREPLNIIFERKQEIYRPNIKQYIHTHDTASETDRDIRNNFDDNETHICHNDNLSSLTYFSQLKDKIIRCNES
ncbi:hypothetical protein I4U23_018115 [Adineta vaga]|nr:hypothetical protein I4U23_018115 [Adineta vaga]